MTEQNEQVEQDNSPLYTAVEVRECAERLVEAFDSDGNVSLGDAWVLAYSHLYGTKEG